ncbi:MAG: PLP-dependent aminotransferase family protein [Terriglobales bacterium]
MARTVGGFFSLPISLARGGGTPLYEQLYAAVRQAILSGTLRKGLRLPSTRFLAADLNVSRNIVLLAFEQLLAEGYLEARTGAGTFVASSLPEEVLLVRAPGAAYPPVLSARGQAMRALSQRELSKYLPAIAPALRYAPFRLGLPALDALPLDLWGRLLARHCRRATPEVALHGDPGGYQPLREAIAAYAGAARGVRCQPEQVLIVNGSQQAIDLAARLLADAGDTAAVEDPGYGGARAALQAAGVKLHPVAVGSDGMRVELLPEPSAASARSEGAPQPARAKAGRPAASRPGARAHHMARCAHPPKLVYVTPSHQFPTGVVLSLAKRLHLLDWAERNRSYILEDDFDSEFRFTGRPIPALQGLDQTGRVIYLGTFSKVLFPSLRLGYMIVPERLCEAFIAARWTVDRCSPLVEQAALADFIGEGHLARHIRRMRALYMERQAALTAAIAHELAGELEAPGAEAGMHLVGWLREGVRDDRVAAAAVGAGLYVLPVSDFALRPLPRGGLLLGFAAFPPKVLTRAVAELGRVIRGAGAAMRAGAGATS